MSCSKAEGDPSEVELGRLPQRRLRGREEERGRQQGHLLLRSEYHYRVSHPIVREVSSCFVLGVPLPLGSTSLQERPTSRGKLPKTYSKDLYDYE